MKQKYTFKKGEKFGKWTVLSEERNLTRSKASILCKCECGREQLLDVGRLARGLTNMCRYCCPVFHKQNLGKGKINFGNISGAYLYYLRKNAKIRGYDFELDAEFLWNLYLDQDRKCALTGIPIEIKKSLIGYNGNKATHPDIRLITASLDRINSDLGYIKSNVCWVFKPLNIMKGSLPNDKFWFLCKKVYEYLKQDNFEPSFSIEDFIVEKKVQRLDSELSSSDNESTSAVHPIVKLDDDIV